jgi:hypothetical protein
LSNATAVNFGSLPGTILSDTGTTIVATDPAEYAGYVNVTVTVGSITTATSLAD